MLINILSLVKEGACKACFPPLPLIWKLWKRTVSLGGKADLFLFYCKTRLLWNHLYFPGKTQIFSATYAVTYFTRQYRTHAVRSLEGFQLLEANIQFVWFISQKFCILNLNISITHAPKLPPSSRGLPFSLVNWWLHCPHFLNSLPIRNEHHLLLPLQAL